MTVVPESARVAATLRARRPRDPDAARVPVVRTVVETALQIVVSVAIVIMVVAGEIAERLAKRRRT
jgi:hypothetical protein